MPVLFLGDFSRTNILRSDAFPCATSKFILPLEQRQMFAGMKIGAPAPLKRKKKKTIIAAETAEIIDVDNTANIIQEEMIYFDTLDDQSDLIVQENILYEEIE